MAPKRVALSREYVSYFSSFSRRYPKQKIFSSIISPALFRNCTHHQHIRSHSLILLIILISFHTNPKVEIQPCIAAHLESHDTGKHHPPIYIDRDNQGKYTTEVIFSIQENQKNSCPLVEDIDTSRCTDSMWNNNNIQIEIQNSNVCDQSEIDKEYPADTGMLPEDTLMTSSTDEFGLPLSDIYVPENPDDSRQYFSTYEAISKTTAVIVFTHSRLDYLKKSLELISKHHPRGTGFILIISQDMQDMHEKIYMQDMNDKDEESLISRMNMQKKELSQYIEEFIHTERKKGAQGISAVHWKFDIELPKKFTQSNHIFVNVPSYIKISRHYKWALARAFSAKFLHPENQKAYPRFHRLIILEDDILISPDFFTYFASLTSLLHTDPTLYCVSAWNDNGKKHLSHSPTQLHRTDFFPGLGWMLLRTTFAEVFKEWPVAFWDDWYRKSEIRKHRQCIRPEFSRTENIGEIGVSKSFDFKKHIGKIIAYKGNVTDFGDLSYLYPENYEKLFFSRLSRAVRVRYYNRIERCRGNHKSDFVIQYIDTGFDQLSRKLDLIGDHREGVRRTSYRGIIVYSLSAYEWVFLVPKDYDGLPQGYSIGASDC